MKIDIVAQRGLQNAGQGNYSAAIENDRGIYPAIVVPYGTNDNSEQNRIRARIVSLDDDGKIQGKSNSIAEENYNNYSGKDATITDNNLVLCIPLMPEFFHVRPQVGEMVFVIMENPKDNTGVRYWIGPIISSKLKLRYQSYEDSAKIFNKTDFISNKKTSNSALSNIFPEDSDVAIQGRNDADLILKSRESLLVAGKFENQNFDINIERPSYLRLKQFDSGNQNIPTNTSTTTAVTVTHEIQVGMMESGTTVLSRIIVINLKDNTILKDELNTSIDRKQSFNWLNERIDEEKKKYKNWSFVVKENTKEFNNYPKYYSSNPTSPITAPPPTKSNEDLLKKYSQATLVSTSINIYSPRGKFRGNDIKPFEKNKDLKSFDTFTNSLHPVVFGDEAIRLFDIIIRLLLTHIHHPQSSLLSNALSEELKKYTVDGWLQNLISNHVRVN